MSDKRKKVLFVCIHNSCRSVMAEAIFNANAKEWRAESAGVETADKIDSTAVRMLEEAGYTVEKEKPRTLDEVDLEDFELIITVCEESSIHPYLEAGEALVSGGPRRKEQGNLQECYGGDRAEGKGINR